MLCDEDHGLPICLALSNHWNIHLREKILAFFKATVWQFPQVLGFSPLGPECWCFLVFKFYLEFLIIFCYKQISKCFLLYASSFRKIFKNKNPFNAWEKQTLWHVFYQHTHLRLHIWFIAHFILSFSYFTFSGCTWPCLKRPWLTYKSHNIHRTRSRCRFYEISPIISPYKFTFVLGIFPTTLKASMESIAKQHNSKTDVPNII